MFVDGKQVLLVQPAGMEPPPLLRALGLRVTVANDAAAAIEIAGRDEHDMAMIDAAIAGEGDTSLPARMRRATAVPSVVVLAEAGDVRRAIRLLAAGADDYLVKPLDRAEVLARVGRILTWQHVGDRATRLTKEIGRKYVLGNIVTRSAGMRRVRDQILQVASARSTVLILGESGVGKELVAKAIHYNSPRREAPFVAINCSAIPASLIESELFGHERGAFTGAVGRHKGKFELADGGTIFLDEIGEMDHQTQAKLLRVLAERSFMRVGGGREVRVDVRVLAATNSDLEANIRTGRFREDLYFRLKVITIQVPPLRSRREDIPELARAFLEQIRRDNGLGPVRLTAKAVSALCGHAWPGNVRELKNVLESTAITRPGTAIRARDLPPAVRGRARPAVAAAAAGLTMAEMERDLIRRVLMRHGGNRTHAARSLRIGVRTLQRKIKEYEVQVPFRRGRRPGARHTVTVTPSPGLSNSGSA